jgi:predicted choloylglycine hydrolase
MSKILGLGVLFITLIFSVTQGVLASVDENYTDTSLGTPIVKRIVYVSGTPYERGYQLGYQTGDVYNLLVQKLWVKEAYIGTREEIIEYLYNYENTVKNVAPEIIEEMHGIVDGAVAAGCHITYEDVLLANWYWNLPPPGWKGSCSSFGAWGSATKDGEPLWSLNDDSYYYPDVYFPILVGFSEGGKAWIYTEAQNPSSGMNSDGLVAATQWNPSLPEDEAYGMTEALAVAWILQRASNSDEAREVLLDKVPNPPTRNYIFMDARPKMYVVEATPTKAYTRIAGDYGEKDFMVTTNHFMSKEWGGRYAPPGPEHWNYNSWTRYATVFKKIEMNYGKIDADVALEIMSSREYWDGTKWVGADKFPEGVPSRYYINWEGEFEGTKANYTFLPKDRKLLVVTGPPDGGLPGYLGKNGYVTLALKETPFATNEQMGIEALNLILEAAQRLEKGLIHKNLTQMLQDAKEHYFQGRKLTAAAGAASNTLDSLIYYGEASTHFAHAQAYARYCINKSKELLEAEEASIIAEKEKYDAIISGQKDILKDLSGLKEQITSGQNNTLKEINGLKEQMGSLQKDIISSGVGTWQLIAVGVIGFIIGLAIPFIYTKMKG